MAVKKKVVKGKNIKKPKKAEQLIDTEQYLACVKGVSGLSALPRFVPEPLSVLVREGIITRQQAAEMLGVEYKVFIAKDVVVDVKEEANVAEAPVAVQADITFDVDNMFTEVAN
jgi:hypothetical protein